MAKTEKEKQRIRREQGLCGSCNNQAIPGKTRCKPCADKASIRAKERYQKRKKEKQCVSGGCASPALADSVYCLPCLDRQRGRQEGTAEARRAAQEKVKQDRINQGACPDCNSKELFRDARCRTCWVNWRVANGAVRHQARKEAQLCLGCDNVSPDYSMCEICREKRSERYQGRKGTTTCCYCGGRNDTDTAGCSACSDKRAGKYRSRKAQGLCPTCGAETNNAGFCDSCLEKNRHKNRKKSDKLRDQILEAYGGKCAQCGFDNPDALQVDHINDDGSEHRREISGKNWGCNIYTWLRKNNFPQENFQLLCANCNQIKAKKKTRKPRRKQPSACSSSS